MRERLRRLYGEREGEAAAAGLAALLDACGRRLGSAAAGRRTFNQADVILITYGDTFVQPGRAPLAALAGFAARHLAGLVSGIHLLPFYPYSSDYGFSVLDPLRVNPELGGWEDVAALGARFDLMFDFVLNHASAESAWFQAFLRGEPPYDRFFITVDPATDLSQVTRPRTSPLLTRFETAAGPRWVWTTFGPDQVDLDYANPQVLLRMVEVMLAYVERGARLLRLDAVGYLWKRAGTTCIHLPQTHEVVKLLREVLDRVAPGVVIVTETNVPHRDNVAYFGNGRDEAQMVYQFPLPPLVLDAFARGDAGRLAGWAERLPPPSAGTAFFNFLASHDGIGVVPARGLLAPEEVAALARNVLAGGGEVSFRATADGGESPYELNATFFDALAYPTDGGRPPRLRLDRYLCSQAIMLALAGVPGIYVHSLFGSRNDRAGYARSGWKRDLNHGRLDVSELEARLAGGGETATIFSRYAGLLRARRGNPAFSPAAAQRVLPAGPAVFALERISPEGRPLLALHNVSSAPQAVARTALPASLEAVDLLTGRRLSRPEPLVLDPYQVLWLEPA